MIVSPPKAGKTTLLKKIANFITTKLANAPGSIPPDNVLPVGGIVRLYALANLVRESIIITNWREFGLFAKCCLQEIRKIRQTSFLI